MDPYFAKRSCCGISDPRWCLHGSTRMAFATSFQGETIGTNRYLYPAVFCLTLLLQHFRPPTKFLMDRLKGSRSPRCQNFWTKWWPRTLSKPSPAKTSRITPFTVSQCFAFSYSWKGGISYLTLGKPSELPYFTENPIDTLQSTLLWSDMFSSVALFVIFRFYLMLILWNWRQFQRIHIQTAGCRK